MTGGAGYVGAVLVPRLLAQGYAVRVLDLYLFGERVLGAVKGHRRLEQVKGDIRDTGLLRQVLRSTEMVIHLAGISNDPSFELNPALSRAINYEAFRPLVEISRSCGVRRFIYASTSSVYGVSQASHVTEDHPCAPLTAYSRYKALCEPILLESQSPDFAPVVLRPATVCGYSPRQRLDLTVNIFTNHAVNAGRITVLGGRQRRPSLHIEDMADLYVLLCRIPAQRIAGKIYNAGYENHTIAELAQTVREVVQQTRARREPIEMVTVASDDQRSYHISSEKIKQELGFVPQRSIQDAVRDLVQAFQQGKIPHPLSDSRYFNVKTLQQARLN